MQSLEQSTVDSLLPTVPEWKIEAGELTRTFTLADFKAALALVNKVGEKAEQAGHHPDIDIRYNRVRFSLTTHDAGGLTQNDFDMATQINKLA